MPKKGQFFPLNQYFHLFLHAPTQIGGRNPGKNDPEAKIYGASTPFFPEFLPGISPIPPYSSIPSGDLLESGAGTS